MVAALYKRRKKIPDATMNYSSAIFASPDTTMHEGQQAKVRRALTMAQVRPGDRVLEIGCGWGALAEMATTEFDASLVGVTLSTEQLDWAQARMERAGIPSIGATNEASGSEPCEAASAGQCKSEPRNRLRRAAGGAAPSGGSEPHEVGSVGAS